MKLKITEIKFSIIHLKGGKKRYTATRIAYIYKEEWNNWGQKDRSCCFGVGDCRAFTSEAYDDERDGEGRGWR